MEGVKGSPKATWMEGPTCNDSREEGELRMVGMLKCEAFRRGDYKQDAAGEEEIKQ